MTPRSILRQADQEIAETKPVLESGERWLHAAMVAKSLGVRPRTVQRWIKAKKVRATRTFGGHYRIDPAELARIQSLMSQRR